MLLTMAAVCNGLLAQQRQWSLDDCIGYALEHNITLQKAQLQTQSAEEDVKGARSALLPSVSASTNQSMGYRPWQDSGTTTVSNGQMNTKVDKGYYNGSYGINAQWTLWNGNKNRNTLRQNKLTAEQADMNAQTTANSIQEQIAQLYVQILYLTEAVKVSEQSLETSRKNEERGKQMMEVGKLSKADVAQLTAQRATDEYNIVQARANITKYITELQHLMTYDEEGPFELAIPTTTDEQALADIPVLQTVYEQAVAQRPEIKGSELGVKSSELGVKMARAGYSPTLSLTGGVGTSTNSLSDNTWGKQMKTNFDASAGLSLSIPLFDQRQTKTAIRKAKLQQLQAQLELDYQKDELYETVKGYWIDAETNQQRLRAAIVSEECEQQSFDLLQEQFNLGLKNIVELLQGKDKLLTAQQNRLESKYQTLLAMKMLKFYATPSRPPLKGRRV